VTRRVRKSQDVHSNPFQLLYLCKRQKGSPDTKKRSLTSCDPVELSTKSLARARTVLPFLLFLVPIFLMKGDGVSGVKSFSEVDQAESCPILHLILLNKKFWGAGFVPCAPDVYLTTPLLGKGEFYSSS